MAWYNWAGPAGAAAGAGLGDVAEGVFDTLNAPRRFLWDKAFGTSSGSELLRNIFGMDQEGFGAQLGGTALEMLLDPVNLLGAGALGKAGSLLGGAGKGLATRAAERAAVAGELGAVNKLRQSATSGLRTLEGAEDTAQALSKGASAIPSQAGLTYNPEVLSELPSAIDLGGRNTMQTYRRVNPAVSNEINQLGLGYSTPEGTFTYQKPSFARGSGGVLQKYGDFPSSPLLQEISGGPAGAASEFDLAQMLKPSPSQISGRPPMPMMADFTGGGARNASEFAGLAPKSMADYGSGLQNLADMDLQSGLGFANQRASELRRQLLQMNDPSNLSRLQQIMMRLGIGG